MTASPGLRSMLSGAMLALAAGACTPALPETATPAAGPDSAPQLTANPLLGAWRMTPGETRQGWIDRAGLNRVQFTQEAMVTRHQSFPVRYTVHDNFVLVRADRGDFFVYEVLAADRVCLQGIGIGTDDSDAAPGPAEERVCYQRV